jgi:hypothetical protein
MAADDGLIEARQYEEPQDRLTRVCDAMTTTFDAHPETRETDKCMVFLDDGSRGGIVLHGYEDSTEAFVDLLMHLKAIFKTMGKRLDIMFLDEDGTARF